MPVRLFTVEEANQLVPRLETLVDQGQKLLARLRDARDQLVDLRIVWEDQVEKPSCPGHEEYERYRREFSAVETELGALTNMVASLGCEIKDLEQGLVDFATSRGEEVVYLCWRRGEPRVGYWHSLNGGFAARQPIQRS